MKKLITITISALLTLVPTCIVSSEFIYQEHNAGRFETYAEQKEFHRLLHKHGLKWDVSVIYYDKQGAYFYQDGKRCSFR